MLLPYLIIIPFISGILCFFFKNKFLQFSIAVLSNIINLIISIFLFINSNYSTADINGYPTWTLESDILLFPSLNINFNFAIDRFSIKMIILITLIWILSIIYSWHEIQKNIRFFYFNILFILSGMIGVFVSINLLILFFFWEMILFPMCFILNDSGTINKRLFVFSQFISFILFVSIITIVFIYYKNTGILTFNYSLILKKELNFNIDCFLINLNIEFFLMLGFFYAFTAFNIPSISLHVWIKTNSVATTAVSMLLSGIFIQIALYGIIRFTLPLFPNASHTWSNVAIVFGIINIVYATVLAIVNTDLKKIISYYSISYIGFLIIGIYSFNKLAKQGVVIYTVSHIISSVAFFMICGELYKLFNTYDIRKMGLLFAKRIYLTEIILFFSLSSIGIPGTGIFFGKLIMLMGLLNKWKLLYLIYAFISIFYSIAFVFFFTKIFFGGLTFKYNKLNNVNMINMFLFIVIAILLIVLGTYPNISK